ncbi:MAG: TIGR03751 family conjugal transfer lipoprotein [Gammaproteobacteria bacterium]|jgi:conjugative transfer region lipoprotein (TIGR03751 family)|nr:TIGR03751 family conjugal transfer lipoprotein [Gammaproteobacteria bacterium]MBT4196621.1 TIGR03751 family conjugal transfer lipoprotein [Gammaproteobacteria bacterium]MBT6456224.1 TIGR03751 family conjugal transfer lipoprotein [Gammaproteobacteria bacterium]MBT7208094.1 TIGR03751 family conjugal transfer lipoprotein [Gammaproteobacteria bacterium]
MPIKYPLKQLLPATLISLTLLTGCSSQKLIPDTGDEILNVYKNHVGSTDIVPKMFRQLRNDRRDLTGYTREANNEISQQFPRLPNPELSLYVFPHFSRKGHPVPGYSSAFLMYERDEYALPGELVQ